MLKKDKIRLEIIFGISAVLIISAIIVSRKNMTEFKINKFNYILEIYDTQKIQMKNFNNDIEFESSNEDIVTVSPEGEMTGLNEGKTSIIVYDLSLIHILCLILLLKLKVMKLEIHYWKKIEFKLLKI